MNSEDIAVVHISETSPETVDIWKECIRSAIFSDLVTLVNYDSKIYSELFYGRSNAILEFKSALSKSSVAGTNFIVLGEAGVGKSTFVYRFFLDEDSKVGELVYPIFIDFKKGALNLESAHIKLIDCFVEYFFVVGRPVNTLKDPASSQYIAYNLLKITEHLTTLASSADVKPLLLLVDDLDYMDDIWLEFLMSIQNLVESPKISFVLSLRPLLQHKIQVENDVLHRDIVRGAKRIQLEALPIADILIKRLAPIIQENNSNVIHSFFKKLFRRDSALCRVLRKQYNIKNLEDLARFEFPFSDDMLNFITQVTNGNIREAFDIAEALLRYIFLNASSLPVVEEDGERKYIVSPEIVLDIFHTNFDAHESNYKLFNLHEVRSDKGASLYHNVLQAVKFHGAIGDPVLRRLSKNGHSKKSVDDALHILSDRTNEMIVPVRTNETIGSDRRVIMLTEYQITKKGEKYLEMGEDDADWQCYRDTFGSPGLLYRTFL